jgi:SAM-dependent methyltransferase
MYTHTAHFYDFFDHDDPAPLRHAEFVGRYARAGTTVLDVGSGTGRVALLLAERGARVCCVEPSAAMRAVMLARLVDDSTRDDAITLLPGDAQTLNLGRTFDVIAACHMLYLLDDDALSRALTALRAHMHADGVLIGDFALAAGRSEHTRTLASTRTVGEVDYRKYTASRQVDAALWQVDWLYEAWHAGSLIDASSETFDVRVRDGAACRELLQAHGFAVQDESGDYAGGLWRDDARAARYVFAARLQTGVL